MKNTQIIIYYMEIDITILMLKVLCVNNNYYERVYNDAH